MAKRGRPPKVPNSEPTTDLPIELVNFDKLPDTAHVRLPVVTGLYGCSPSAIWRNVKSGAIPAPRKLTPNVTAWRVSDLREALANKAA